MGFGVKIKSRQEELLLLIWVGKFFNWWLPEVDVRVSIIDPWLLVMPWDHQFLDLALKCPVMTEANGFSSLIFNMSMLKLEQISSNWSLLWLGDLFKLVRKHLLLFIGVFRVMLSFKEEISFLQITERWSL